MILVSLAFLIVVEKRKDDAPASFIPVTLAVPSFRLFYSIE